MPDQDFPFVLTTGRLLEHWHTGAMTRRASVLNDIEPNPIVNMNKLDMEFLKLNPGTSVNVETRRGKITLM